MKSVLCRRKTNSIKKSESFTLSFHIYPCSSTFIHNKSTLIFIKSIQLHRVFIKLLYTKNHFKMCMLLWFFTLNWLSLQIYSPYFTCKKRMHFRTSALFYANAFFAVSTSCLNPSASWIAISESIFLLIVIFDFLSPFINFE